jgi:hypothetical protein
MYSYVDSEELMSTIRAVNDALEDVEDELRVLGRHELIIATPGAKNILTTDREFQVHIYIFTVILVHTVMLTALHQQLSVSLYCTLGSVKCALVISHVLSLGWTVAVATSAIRVNMMQVKHGLYSCDHSYLLSQGVLY